MKAYELPLNVRHPLVATTDVNRPSQGYNLELFTCEHLRDSSNRLRTLIYNWDLVFNLIQRDIKIHYRRSVLGILWTQINPLLSLIIFSFVFQQVVPLNIPNYPAYVFTALLVWNWFSSSLLLSSYSLANSRDLVRKPQFATEMIVVVSIGANFVNFLLSTPILIGLLLFNNLIPNWTLVFLPLLLVIQFAFTLGLALIISASNVFFHDVMHIANVLVTGWFYITPIFYRPLANRHDFDFLYSLNPMNLLITAYRDVLLRGEVPNLGTLLILVVVAPLTLALGMFFFQRVKYSFVDML